jgi:glutathione S-transferase
MEAHYRKMNSMLELYHNDMSSCAQKVRGQLAEKGLDWTGHALDLRAGEGHTSAYLKINPKGVVPVIVHDGTIVTESNIIMEYIEDAFPHQRPLMPSDAAGRARVRGWLQQLDTGLHFDVAVISLGVAFRHQLLAMFTTPEALEAHYASISLPGLGDACREIVPLGVTSPAFIEPLARWVKAIIAIEAALAEHTYLAGDTLTIADIAFLPYICRLEQLHLEQIWRSLPQVSAWLARMHDTEAYRQGIEKWLNPKYVAGMAQGGEGARAELTPIIDRLVAQQ